MGDAIKSAITALGGTTNTTAVWEAIGSAIVAYIAANAVVTTSTPGVQSGGSVAPGTGTIS